MTPTLWLVLIIVIILVVWWLMSRSAETEKPDIAVHAHEEAHEEAAPAETAAAETPPAEEPPAAEPEAAPVEAAPVTPDNLAVLEGIGPKVNQILQAAGIQTFAQLAGANMAQLQKILEDNSLQFMDPASWPEQAQLLAEGKTEELQALQARLKGGRKVD